MSGTETIIRLPDLVTLVPFPLHINLATKAMSQESDAWLIEVANLSEKERRKLASLNIALYAGMGCARCGPDKLRICMDFVNFACSLDDMTDKLDRSEIKAVADSVMDMFYHPHTGQGTTTSAKLVQSFWLRMLPTTQPRSRQRFISAMDQFLYAMAHQARDRAQTSIPELEHYIALRRDSSGWKPVCALIEYAYDLDLPDEVMDHPVVLGLLEASSDTMSRINDILSYNVEQAQGDYHNLIASIMHTKGLDVQAAMDYGGKLVQDAVERFLSCKAALPSWGEDIDKEVAIFVQGCEDWMIANPEWSFGAERYFGQECAKVRETLQVSLLAPHSSG